MNFTREPVVETIITPKEGFKLLLRNSRGGLEEFFVDAVEVISFGHNCFFRSLEKPKQFLVPVNEYEIIEVREARVVLKSPGLEKGIKIAGGRDAALKVVKEMKEEDIAVREISPVESAPSPSEYKSEKKREKRRYRKRKGRPDEDGDLENESSVTGDVQPTERVSLIPPPALLISETIGRNRIVHAESHSEKSFEEKETSEKTNEEVPFT